MRTFTCTHFSQDEIDNAPVLRLVASDGTIGEILHDNGMPYLARNNYRICIEHAPDECVDYVKLEPNTSVSQIKLSHTDNIHFPYGEIKRIGCVVFPTVESTSRVRISFNIEGSNEFPNGDIRYTFNVPKSYAYIDASPAPRPPEFMEIEATDFTDIYTNRVHLSNVLLDTPTFVFVIYKRHNGIFFEDGAEVPASGQYRWCFKSKCCRSLLKNVSFDGGLSGNSYTVYADIYDNMGTSRWGQTFLIPDPEQMGRYSPAQYNNSRAIVELSPTFYFADSVLIRAVTSLHASHCRFALRPMGG